MSKRLWTETCQVGAKNSAQKLSKTEAKLSQAEPETPAQVARGGITQSTLRPRSQRFPHICETFTESDISTSQTDSI